MDEVSLRRILKNMIKDNPQTPIRLVQSLIGQDFTAWLDIGGDIENNIVSVGTFETNPYIIFRWSLSSGELYGRGPVMRALPDIKTANKVVELVLKNATIAVSGIWQDSGSHYHLRDYKTNCPPKKAVIQEAR